ncbi:MAG: cytochrome P450 [Acidobacteriota bacterium]
MVSRSRDPLPILDHAFPAAGNALWLPDRQLWLADPEAARGVLANEDGLYEEHSDFFYTRHGPVGPRSAQVAIGRRARELLLDHLKERSAAIPAAVADVGPERDWPDAGNWLVYRHLEGALIAPGTPLGFRRLVERVVERAVLAGARERQSRARRAFFRFQVALGLEREIDRRQRGRRTPVDLLDAVLEGAAPGTPAPELGEVYLSCVFAVAGSVGFTLAWSLFLLGTHPPTEADPEQVVREALRLWPIAWMLGRRPVRPHTVAGVAVTPDDLVVASPYLVHRHPEHWEEPRVFRPERWTAPWSTKAYIPFGWGPHTCVAAALSLQLVARILGVILERYRLSLTCQEPRPQVGPALAPPRFVLRLDPRRPGAQHKERR